MQANDARTGAGLAEEGSEGMHFAGWMRVEGNLNACDRFRHACYFRFNANECAGIG